MSDQFTHHPDQPEPEIGYASFGPVSATASADGVFVSIDFVSTKDSTKALRLVIPSVQIENCITALRHIQKAMADPTSGIHFQLPH